MVVWVVMMDFKENWYDCRRVYPLPPMEDLHLGLFQIRTDFFFNANNIPYLCIPNYIEYIVYI